MTEPTPVDGADYHVTALLQSVNRMMEALSMMTLGEFRATIILRHPEVEAASVVVTADPLPDLADYLARIRDRRMTNFSDELERKH